MKLLATLNYETKQIHWTEDEQYNPKTFLVFLQQIFSAYPNGGKIVMVLDMPGFIMSACYSFFWRRTGKT
ncbi:hypothetical protein JFN88_01765 [Paenibacillus sp. MAHUQ-46]|uniref:Uncharacterized protein n=1 Tax=Paenibacillus roseus TaxID=2798579 RepID=A0A934IVG2_9BACL|nr:hypothetical protein [Paenibacillus roseus]